jgi:Amt family ammonium transporter
MSLLSGALGGLLVVFAILAFDKVKLDDPVGALSVHGVAGILGLLLVPISNADASLSAQLTGIGAIFGFVFVSSFIVWSILKDTIGIRVEAEHEYIGADISECGLTAYPEFTAS